MNQSNVIEDQLERTSLRRWIKSPWFLIIFAALIILGIFFRLYGLGTKIYSHDEAMASLRAAGYSRDEVLTDLWDGNVKTVEDIQEYLKPSSTRGVVDTLRVNATSDPHQAPLYYVLAHYWLRVAGYTPVAMRSLAAIISIFSIIAFYWLSIEFFQSKHTALLATALFSISPYQILFAQDARPYSLWTLATILSSAALFYAIRKNKPVAWIIYSLSLILGLYTHQLFILVAVVHGIYIVWMDLFQRNRLMNTFLSACLAAILTYIPWLYIVFTRWSEATSRMSWATNYMFPWYQYFQRWAVIFSSPFLDLDFEFSKLLPYFLRALILLSMIYSLLFMVRRGLKRQTIFLLLVYLVTAGGLISGDLLLGGIGSAYGRYYVPASIASILLIAYWLSSNLERSLYKGKWIILTNVLLIASISSNINILNSETWWNKELGRIRPEFVAEINKAPSLLIVSGYYDTNLGDVLSLSLEVKPDTQFMLFRDASDINYPNNSRNIFWYPASHDEIEKISSANGFKVEEVLPGTLWQIE